MKKPDLPYLTAKKIRGKERLFYRTTWLEGGKRRERYIEITADPNTPEFMVEYWSIRSGKSPKVRRQLVKTSWRVLITEYRSSPKFRKLAPRTKQSYNIWLEKILAKNADKDVRDMDRATVRAMQQKLKDTPRQADWFVQIVRILFNFAAKQLDWNVRNPAEGIDLFGKQREFEPWPEWMVEKARAAPENVRTIIELILGTGQRPSAAIAMRRDQFEGDIMTVTDEKGDEAYQVYCPDGLRSYVEALPIRGRHLVPKNMSQAISYSAAEKALSAWRATLGDEAKPFTLHGLRKLSIVRLAEAGCTDAQIQAITNQSPQMVAYYRKKASKKRLSKAAHKLAEQNRDRT
ncbi:tyrosine-type recombinase/integrase [Thioclava sp. 'Guangxiensis']|uniref:tyrosine-type recombinase/integrase n=1 Tax=Thioclava sp. 'Guangxiensis' TaxID=3149044 RepID=UPI0038781BAE